MLDREQRDRIIKLFGEGLSISEIARRVGVSRQSVYRVIESDVERDPEIKKLEKELKKAELMKKIKEVREPIERASELDRVKDGVNKLFSDVLISSDLCRDVPNESHRCIYCDGPIEYHEEEKPSGISVNGYLCRHCNIFFHRE